jgi:RNA polymerase sigma-70 factor (ECF subfamily)
MTDLEDPLEPLELRLLSGDRQALAEAFSRCRDRLLKMVELRLDRRLAVRLAPADILQEAYIDAEERLPHFLSRERMPLYLWLRLITGQRLAEVHRRHLGAQARNAALEISLQARAPSVSSICLAEHLLGRFTTPSQAAMRLEAAADLERALNGLDPIDREILSLRHFEELSNQEVALSLGLKAATASKRYVRALARLRQALEKAPGDSE